MKKEGLKSLSFAVLCGFCAHFAVAGASLFSDYGQIQNVQNYSTNPFWSPGSPYNQRVPQPVYVQGTDLNAEDCINVVQPLVAVQCMARNNCKDTALSEIRPTIMVQLSNLPNDNYVSACSGYIDTIFESYVAQYGDALPNRAVAFPNATNPSNYDNNTIQIKNPYKVEPAKWQKDVKERKDELQQLQKQNGAGQEHLTATDFPTTYADLSFSDRMALAAEDYAQYKDMNTYVVPNFQNESEWCSGKGAGTAECAGWEKKQAAKKAKEKKKGEEDKDIKECTKEELAAIDPHATEGKKSKDGKCEITACEGDLLPNDDGTKCEESSVYYDLRIYTESLVDIAHKISLKTTRDSTSNLCYSVCGIHTKEDDVNRKVLLPILGEAYCVPKKATSFNIDTDNFILQSVKDGKKIKLSEQQYEKVLNGLNTIKDQGECDGFWKDIEVVFFKHDTASGTSTRVNEITLDD